VERPTPSMDQDLVSRAAAGDLPAFGELVSRHQDRVYGLAFHLLRDAAEAEEVVQETFLVALEKLSTFRGDAAFGTWLHRVAANAALMRMRKRQRAPDRLGAEPVEELLPHFDSQGHLVLQGPAHDWSKRADEQLSDRQIRRSIADAVQNLPGDYRIVFLLRDVEGLSSEAMAELLGITVAAVKSRLHRARLALRERLGHYLA